MTGKYIPPTQDMNGLWRVEFQMVGPVTMSAGGESGNLKFALTEYSGWKPVGIVGYGITNGNDGSGMTFTVLIGISLSQGDKMIQVRAKSYATSGSPKVYVNCWVLYFKETEETT